MRTIAVINQKGGCGKTTVSINLSATLASKGFRTLLIDMDPQGHCAVGLAVPEEQIEKSIYDVLISNYSDSKTEFNHIVWQISQNYDLAPASIELAALEPQLAGQENREACLQKALAECEDKYEYVIIDCPPSVGILTFNALRASDEVIIPVETGYFALHGLGRELETLDVLKQQCDQDIKIRILANMYDVRTKLAREVFNELKMNFNAFMFDSPINFNTKLKEAASFGQPITEYDPVSKGMKDFMALVDEITENRSAQTIVKQQVESVTAQLDRISKSADDLIAESNKMIGQPATILQKPENSIEEKIDNFYGIRQKQGRVEFAVLYPKAQTVQLAGDFNNWKPENTPLLKSDPNGRWNIELELDGGVYHYRYVVDGRWQQDPYNNNVETNPYGELNSVLEVS